jgi:ASC-1-like (ASCH) protein
VVYLLKTQPEYFNAVRAGEKTFELRKDDRGYKVGDELHLQELKENGDTTGRCIAVEVTYILRGPIFGLMAGWVIMGVTEV